MSRWPPDSRPPGELRSFGRRRSRGGSVHKDRLFDRLLPALTVDLANPLAGRGADGATPRPVWLEIGFGGGEHLVWQAEHATCQPLIIGCEPFENGVGKVLVAIDEAGGAEGQLGASVRLHVDDARPLLRALPDRVIDRAFVLFPDPWPKRKHMKRRLINGALLDELARVMAPGAELRVATDIPDYARTMLMAFQDTPFFQWRAMTAEDWRQRPADWPETHYERKAIAEGRDRCYLRFIRR